MINIKTNKEKKKDQKTKTSVNGSATDVSPLALPLQTIVADISKA